MDQSVKEVNQPASPPQPAQPHGMSEDSKTLVTVLLLFLLYPVGLVLMWVWTKWKLWVKIILTLPLPLMFLMIPLLTVALVAINPVGQIAKANNAQRMSDLNSLMQAFELYKAQNSTYPSSLTYSPVEISSAGLDVCKDMVPMFLSGVPIDPSSASGESIADCSKPYATSYVASLNEDGTVTLTAPQAESGEVISVTQ